MPSINGLATTAALTVVESKTLNVIRQWKKKFY